MFYIKALFFFKLTLGVEKNSTKYFCLKEMVPEMVIKYREFDDQVYNIEQ